LLALFEDARTLDKRNGALCECERMPTDSAVPLRFVYVLCLFVCLFAFEAESASLLLQKKRRCLRLDTIDPSERVLDIGKEYLNLIALLDKSMLEESFFSDELYKSGNDTKWMWSMSDELFQ
jgi:hypothetical protein